MPTEYLTLTQVGGNNNFSQYTQGGASPGTNVRTSYSRVRLDPITLLVDISDRTFATSSGLVFNGGAVTSMPYGVAYDCRSPFSRGGRANVNLDGTAFAIFRPSAFHILGFLPNGSVSFGPGSRTADLTGGGFCGGSSLGTNGGDPFRASGFRLRLSYVGGVTGSGPETCQEISEGRHTGDGTYTIYPNGQVFDVHCHGMPPPTEFDDFTIEEAEIEFADDDDDDGDEFEVEGSFTLGAGSGGIDVSGEEVFVEFGTFSQTIAAASFVRDDDDEGWEFDDGNLKVTIRDDGDFEVKGDGVDLTGTDAGSEVGFSLQIGNDVGDTTIQFDDEGKFELDDE